MAEPARDLTSTEDLRDHDDLESVDMDTEASPSDLLDQARTVWDAEEIAPLHIPDDVPEADALEQARIVSLDEDIDRYEP
jgi:hypothetical protein